jgi:hypothetical protein
MFLLHFVGFNVFLKSPCLYSNTIFLILVFDFLYFLAFISWTLAGTIARSQVPVLIYFVVILGGFLHLISRGYVLSHLVYMP